MMNTIRTTHAVRCMTVALSLWATSAMAVNTTSHYADTGALTHSNPVNTQSFSTPLAGGGRYISQQATVQPKQTPVPAEDVFTIANKQWTYTRGVGKIPSVCKTGYEKAGLLCKKAGASFFSKQIPMECPEGTENNQGLCYTPCAESFKGFGPFCTGNLADLKPNNLSGQLAEQHAAELKKFNQPGVALKEGQAPRIKTDLSFGRTMCALAPAFSVATSEINTAANKVIGKLDGALKNSMQKNGIALDIKNDSGNTIWSVPSLNNFVAYDLSVKPTCTDETDRFVSTLKVDNSVTVKATTKIFDPLFHNLGGVDAGIAKVSIYELIPFRVYGSSGVTLGNNIDVKSTLLKNKPPYMIDGVAHAHQTALNVTPKIKVWLGLDAYVRISSIVSTLPDILQVGGDVDLDVINWNMPYALAEGVRYESGTRKLFIDETLDSEFNAGRGRAKPFLKVFGNSVNAFKDSDTKTWDGYSERKNLLTRQGSY